MLRILLVGLTALTLFSCSNEFDLVDGKTTIPIVYAILDAQDTAHYIRVEKAFADEDVPATTLAQDPQNLYFDNVEVTLTRDETGESFQLERVDGNLEGYVREEGAFAQAPNYLYKVHNDVINLQDRENYTLTVVIPDQETITANTFIIEDPIPSSPSENGNIAFELDRTARFRWSYGIGGELANLDLKFYYQEVTPEGTFDKSIDWNIFRNESKPDNSREGVFGIAGEEFFTFLSNNIEENANAERFFTGMDLTLVTGGEEIVQFLNVAQANLGITSSGEIPSFTNLSSGRGIFASRSKFKLEGLQLSPEGLNNLLTSSLTEGLNFQ